MKKLTYIEAKTENNQTILHFEIPYYSKIHKIEYFHHTSRYQALVLIDDAFAIRSLKDKIKIETYQVIELNQEIDALTGTNLIIISRNDGDIYLLKKIIEPRDDLDRAQDILEFNLENENEDDVNKFDIPF